MLEKKILTSNDAPAVVGPYSLGVKGGSFVFLSGQLGLDPSTGAFVKGGIQEQTRQSLTNLENILQSNGLSLKDVVKTTVFLASMQDFPRMNAVYGEFFDTNPPARSTIEVAALPKSGLVEIEAIAFSGESS